MWKGDFWKMKEAGDWGTTDANKHARSSNTGGRKKIREQRMRVVGNTGRKEVTKCIEKNFTKLFIQKLGPKITQSFFKITWMLHVRKL